MGHFFRSAVEGFELFGCSIAGHSDQHDVSDRIAGLQSRGTLGYLLFAVFSLAVLAGYITHVVVTAWEGSYWLLVLGMLFFPLGVGNGWLIWLGWI